MEEKLYRLSDIMTTTEASHRFHLSQGTIKQLCTNASKCRSADSMLRDDEKRKSGKMWLVTVQGMERLYGKEGNTKKLKAGRKPHKPIEYKEGEE